jgi:hypothetical protein
MSWRRLILRSAGLILLAWGGVLSGISCGGDTVGPPTTPIVRVKVTTSGSFLPEGSYQVSFVGTSSWSYPVEKTGTIEIADLLPGEYTVYLQARHGILWRGLPPNCVVEGAGWGSTITITAGEVTTVAITVSCITPSTYSTLVIGTTTLGPGYDPDGYAVRIDDGDWQALHERLVVPGLAPGVHSVLLGGLASHCQVQSYAVDPPENPQYVTIDAYPEVGAYFMVWCTHRLPSLEVTTITTGPLPDPDGYLLSIAPYPPRRIGVNETVVVDNLTPGPRTVGLSDLAPNCKVDGENPQQTPALGYGDDWQATFSITCSGP